MKNNIANDSIMLTIVRVVTLATSMAQTMILSRIMTLTEYGTYSALLIIVSLGTTIAGLGLNNAISFFFNKEKDIDKKEKYVNTIFAITMLSGTIFAVVIYALKRQIANYYNNTVILNLIIYVIFKPIFTNIVTLYQQLYISVGKTKVIAARNLIISLVQVIAIPITFNIFKNIKSVLIVGIILDVCQLIYFKFDFKKILKINYLNIDIKIIKPILIYAIPMALATMIATIFKESDKLIIAKIATIEDLAIYTNMSKQLPFEFVVLSFTTVITPVIIRLLQNDTKKAIQLWGDYIEFGYISTWILCIGAIICAKELLVFLYSDIYLEGLNIFKIYLLIEMFKYTYFGLILSATGKTKYILYSSGIAMIANIIFNIIFYKIFGLIGPALASLICTISMGMVQLLLSCKEINVNFLDAIRIKNMIKIILKLLIIAIVSVLIKKILEQVINNDIIILIVIYTVYVICSVLINKKRLIYLMENMGKIG